MILTSIPLSALDARAQNAIGYLSSSTGFVLHRSGNTAVVSQWQVQKPIEGFTGYGQIKMDGFCLTGNTGNRPLTWETCWTNDPGQRWAFDNGRLRNERGWCADLEGGRRGANVPVVAWNCSGAGNQVWKAHYPVNLRSTIARIPDPLMRQQVNRKLIAAPPGTQVIFTVSEKKALESVGLIRLDGASLISAGGLGVISLGQRSR
ncbi:MAG: ricin-type beta-trefoil lectin domain protein [Synechococcales cyanobacterium]